MDFDALEREIGRLRAAGRTVSLLYTIPTFHNPAGGFFIWLRLPEGLRASELLPVAEAHGVAFAPGSRFCADGDDSSIRLSFSLFDEGGLRQGASRLGAAMAVACS